MSYLRTLLLIQKKTLTFLMIFAGVIVALAVLVVSLKSRESICQDHAHEVTIPLFIRPAIANTTLTERILGGLARYGLNARLKVLNASLHSFSHVTLDTADKVLRSRSYRLVQQTASGSDSTTFRLSFASPTLCYSRPSFDMEFNHNVDQDNVNMKVFATRVKDNTSSLFVYESSLRTSLVNTITQFSQFQNLVPSFRLLSTVGDSPMISTAELKARLVCSTNVLSPYGPTPVTLNVEEWLAGKDRRYWKITVKCPNPLAELSFKTVWQSLSDEFRGDLLPMEEWTA